MKIIALAIATITVAGIYVVHNREPLEYTTEIEPLIEEKEAPDIDFEQNLDVLPDDINFTDPEDSPILILPPVIVYPK